MKEPSRFGWGALRSLGRGPFSIISFLQAWFTLTFFALFFACGIFVIALLRFQNELPSTAHLERIEPPSNTQIFDRNGASIGDLFAEDRIIVPLSQIPPAMVSAVLAAEAGTSMTIGGSRFPRWCAPRWPTSEAGALVRAGAPSRSSWLEISFSPTRELSNERSKRRC